MIWTEVIGQQRIIRQLEHLINSNQVPHAQLLTGISGYGGLPLGVEFAIQLLDKELIDTSNKSLGEKIQHPDFHFIYPIVKRGSDKIAYSTDYASEWREFLNETPY